ncbi:hypothetical protein C8J56DRAFT_914518 [Mycena floridula]|nr:hypothetical protein C8J56DRAFT_914518 [Mycena floridula]
MADPLPPIRQRSETVTPVAFPEIPNEIVLLILEAVVENEPKKAVGWATLSRDLQPFFERRIYRFVSLSTTAQAASFAKFIASNGRPLSFYHDRIQNLCIAANIDLHDAMIILSACKDIHSLALFTLPRNCHRSLVPYLGTLRALQALRPTRLSIDVEYLVDPATAPRRLNFYCLQCVTHLELYLEQRQPDLQYNDTVLRYLPQLTHLSYLNTAVLLPAALLFASSLCLSDELVVFILWITTLEESPSLDPKLDPRIIIGSYNYWDTDTVLCRDLSDNSLYLKDWGSRRTNEPDIWELAEEIVGRQRVLNSTDSGNGSA